MAMMSVVTPMDGSPAIFAILLPAMLGRVFKGRINNGPSAFLSTTPIKVRRVPETATDLARMTPSGKATDAAPKALPVPDALRGIRVNGNVARLDLSALYFFEPGAWHDVPADGGILDGTVVVDRGDRLGADAL